MARKVALALWVAVCMSAGLPALTHNAPEGWSYDSNCCSSNDCQEVDDVVIRPEGQGYRIHVEPGQHKLVTDTPFDDFIQHGDSKLRVSGDGKKHLCLSHSFGYAGGQFVRCVYVPPGAV